MRNLAEGYIGQDKIAQGMTDAWERIVGAYKRGTVYQARVSAIESKNSDEQIEGPGSSCGSTA